MPEREKIMHIISNLAQLPAIPVDFSRGSALTIGNFDGVHNGHRKLISRVKSLAVEHNIPSGLITFAPHPLKVLLGDKAPPSLTGTAHKLEIVESLGLDFSFLMPFTRELAAEEPENFVREVLIKGLNVKKLAVGYDYCFGKNRRGDYSFLSAQGRELGFDVEQLDPVVINGSVVSSSRIRKLICAGEVHELKPLMSRFHSIRGIVEHGANRGGRLLGFPTANLNPEPLLLPKQGVYATLAELEGVFYHSVTNIGKNPTFGKNPLSVEVHILDFDSDIYGMEIRLHFVQYLRGEQTFPNLDALIARIKADAQTAREVLDRTGK